MTAKYADGATLPSSAIGLGVEKLEYGAVHLDVTDLDRSLRFWRDLIGLEYLANQSGDEGSVSLGAAGREILTLHPGAARAAGRGQAGLYHLAIHLPDEQEFARVLARLLAARYPQAPTDHLMSKVTYLDDPDGIGLELTLETMERFGAFEEVGGTLVARDREGNLRSGRDPLDLDEVFSHLHDDDLVRPLPPGSKVGHVHLHVPDLDASVGFYRDLVGFESNANVMPPGMVDLGAGGSFPHRIALNTWRGHAARPSADSTGLRRLTIYVRDPDELKAIAARLKGTGAAGESGESGLEAVDPTGNRLRFVLTP